MEAEDLDPKELKRQMDRARFSTMSDEQKDQRNKKRRESYMRKKVGAKNNHNHDFEERIDANGKISIQLPGNVVI
jgi:hypothetical protein